MYPCVCILNKEVNNFLPKLIISFYCIVRVVDFNCQLSWQLLALCQSTWTILDAYLKLRVRNLNFATYLKFATCENTNKINELW